MSLPNSIQFQGLTIPGPQVASCGWIDAAYGECWTRRVSGDLVTLGREGCVFRGVLMLLVTIDWSTGDVLACEEQADGRLVRGEYQFQPVQPYCRVDGSICEYEWRVAA